MSRKTRLTRLENWAAAPGEGKPLIDWGALYTWQNGGCVGPAPPPFDSLMDPPDQPPWAEVEAEIAEAGRDADPPAPPARRPA